VRVDGATVMLRVVCSAGFYVRSLAHDLGTRLGVGAHLAALRRTCAAGYGIDAAIPLADAERNPERAAAAVVPMGRMLSDLPAVVLAGDDVRRAINGRDLAAIPDKSPFPNPESRLLVRLLDEAGDLVGLGEPASVPGLLHPSVILR